MSEVDIVMLGRSRERCSYKNKEIWTCNTGYETLPQDGHDYFSKLFLMHKQVIKNGEEVFDWKIINRFQEAIGFEIITLHKIKELKKTTMYPFKEICQFFGTEYFSSSHSYMMAYAIYKGFEKINLYGCSFLYKVSDVGDDLYDRCGLEYWIGRAEGMGIQVITREEDNLLKTVWGVPYALSGYSSNH